MIAAGDTDVVQLVFGDDAPAELHAAWAAADAGSAATEAAAAAAAAVGASGADVDTSAATASGKAVTEAESALVARLVAALTGAAFDSGDARGIALPGMLARSQVHQADRVAVGPAVQLHVLTSSNRL